MRRGGTRIEVRREAHALGKNGIPKGLGDMMGQQLSNTLFFKSIIEETFQKNELILNN